MDESALHKDNLKQIPDKYDLRDSDFGASGGVITIAEASEMYRDEAIRNIEEEEARKLEQEEAQRQAEEGEGDQEEPEQDAQQDPSQDQHLPDENGGSDPKSNTEDDDNKFMTEESFLERIKEIRHEGSPSKRNKKVPSKESAKDDREDSGGDNFNHPDIPSITDMSKKSKSVRVNLKRAKDTQDEQADGAGTQRKLNIKAKKNKPEDDTKVERLVTLPEPENKRLNTIAFEGQENQKKKYDFNLEDTDPDLQFDPAQIKNIVTEPRETIKLAPVKESKLQTIAPPPERKPATTYTSGFLKNNNYNDLAQAFYPKPPQPKREPAQRRQMTMDSPCKNIQKEHPLLNKWEKQYGGIKDRQFLVEDDPEDHHFTDRNRKLSSFNNPNHFGGNTYADDIPEELPEEPQVKVYVENPLLEKKRNKLEASNSQKEFEFDWDEEESMSYLKKLGDENFKENYHKYGSKNGPVKPPLKTINEREEKVPRKNKHKRSSKSKVKTERRKERNFRSVAPKFVDDWDD